MLGNDQKHGDESDHLLDCDDSGEVHHIPDDADDADPLVSSLREEIDQLNQQVLRSRADYANLQRRSMDTAARARDEAICAVFRELIQVFDQFDRALVQPTDQLTLSSVMEGLRMIRQEFARIGIAMDVREISPAPGSEFDPMEHQALIRQPTDEYPPNSVVAVLQVGYARGTTVLRPASVSVAADPEASADADRRGAHGA